MLETTSLDPQGPGYKFAHAFYRQTIADFKHAALNNSQQNHTYITNQFLELSQIQDLLLTQLNLTFKDSTLLMRAFTHSSYAHESKIAVKSYERLEFYGDSVLGAYVTKNLFLNFDNMNEGQLSKLRSALVNEESLSSIADFLNLSKFLIVGKGELAIEVNSGIRCDLFESLLGAIAIDQGVDRANEFLDLVISRYENETGQQFFSADKLVDFDPKTKLQEETLSRFKCLPEYRAQKVGQEFKVELYVNGQSLGSFTSASKKAATKEIAKHCLKNNLLDKVQ